MIEEDLATLKSVRRKKKSLGASIFPEWKVMLVDKASDYQDRHKQPDLIETLFRSSLGP